MIGYFIAIWNPTAVLTRGLISVAYTTDVHTYVSKKKIFQLEEKRNQGYVISCLSNL